MIIKSLKLLFLSGFILLITGNCREKRWIRCLQIPCPSVFTCKINGDHWKVSQGFCYSKAKALQTSYVPDYSAVPYLGPGYLMIRAIQCEDQTDVDLVMRGGASRSRSYELKDLKDLKDTLAYAEYEGPLNSSDYEYTNIVDGNINLSHIQTDNYDFEGARWGRAKGTFWVTLTNEVGDTVRITDGVFDVDLPNCPTHHLVNNIATFFGKRQHFQCFKQKL